MPSSDKASSRLHLRQGIKAGLQPGSLVHIGEAPPTPAQITITEFSAAVYNVRTVANLNDEGLGCRKDPNADTIVWVNVDGINNAETIAALGERFGLHPLVLEDVMNAGERTKLEEHQDCLFAVLKMIAIDENTDLLLVEQISLILGKGFVISVQERAGDVFDGVRERLRLSKGRVRRMGADYLLYALMDAVVDHYAVALESMAGLVEGLETQLQDAPDDVSIEELYILKRELLFLRRQIVPARDLMAELGRQGGELLTDAVDIFFRDVQDHCTRAAEHTDTLREMISGMLDMYNTHQSGRLNEAMRVLTVISTIFIPLTFIAGVYGMNFKFMPELESPVGYWICLGVMAFLAVIMVAVMRRQKWL
jgi:magnesium transporter